MTRYDTAEIKRVCALEDVIASYGIALHKDGARLTCCCPFHDDKTPSLVIEPKKGVWQCKGPCGFGGSVIDFVMKKEALGLADAIRVLAERFHLAPAADDQRAPERKRVAEYVYTDDAGVMLYRIERWEPGKNNRPKDFLQVLPDGTYKKCARQVLYRWPALLAAPHDVVFVVEGEKCVDALTAIGVLATTAAGGTGAWRTWTPDFAAPLAGRKVVVIADNDEGGVKLGRHIVEILQPIAGELRELALPGLGDKGDVVDWLKAGGTREQLIALASKAKTASFDSSWRTQLLRTREGEVRPSVGNALLALENHEAFAGALWFDERRLAVFTDRAMPWDKPGGKIPLPRPITDDDPVFGAAWAERELRSPISTENMGRAMWALAGQKRRDPLVEWLRAQKWDGKSRCETWLIDNAGSPNTPFVRAVSKLWLISAIARAINPGSKVDHVLVLESDQGKRKSSVLRALAGPGGFADSLPDIDSKDAALILGRTWILELAELESMRKSDVTAMNAFVTRTHDVFRPPYGRTTIEVPRRCVFAASTNESEYLRDPTGNRRWWPVAVDRVDYEAVVAAREQIWAEALVLYDRGEPWWFKGETDSGATLVDLQKDETAAREQLDPWEPLIADFVSGFPHTTITSCFSALGVEKQRQGEADAKRIGKVLRRLKWTKGQRRVDGKREWLFFPPDTPNVVRTPPDDDGGGGTGGTGDSGKLTGDGSQPRPSHVSHVSPVFPSRARAGVQEGIDFTAHLAPTGESLEKKTSDTGDSNATTSTNTVTRAVTRPESRDASQVTVDPAAFAVGVARDAAEMQRLADEIFGSDP